MMVEAQRRKLVALAPLVVAVVGVAVVLFGVPPPRNILVLGMFLLCPLAMLFMHGAHGHEGHDNGTGQRPPGPAHRSEGREDTS